MNAGAERSWVARLGLAVLLLAGPLTSVCAAGSLRASKPLRDILREPLPPEQLKLSENDGEWVVGGPTFQYRVRKSTGAIEALSVARDGVEVIGTSSPADFQLDEYRLASARTSGRLTVVTEGDDKIVLRAEGVLREPAQGSPEVDYVIVHTFFNDGVVVSDVKLTPRQDLPVKQGLSFQLRAQGPFSHYLHKRRDEHGGDAVRDRLPRAGQAVRLSALTSCLQVFSSRATLAVFTDSGASHLSRPGLDTAVIEVMSRQQPQTQVALRQYLLQVAPGDRPYVLPASQAFGFRVGISVAPNRLTPRRLHDLRMFAWIGDAQHPYPTDQEIAQVAQAGYTVFQMHRLGTPGEPRPPAAQLERVLNKVHESGMLFLWTENADLMYASAPGVQEMKAKGQWELWEGFNYGGRYQASMDPYCDLVATCLASPNGLAEYRLATIRRMLERFQVDGIYLDDNLAYANCTLGREHGHPKPVYDCLIELHEVNWRRRQLLRTQCPHQVLVTHNTRAIVQPVICDFDAVLYGEGYSFGSLENYWDYYRPVNAMPAQGMIWPGGQDPDRCPAAVAYNYDLLTGGGQYCYIDWRLFPKKFPHAAGVTDLEQLYVRTYNLAQAYFGFYESHPYYFADSAALFATTTPLTYATLYRNRVWGDWLIALANMSRELQKTSLEIRTPQTMGFEPEANYLLLDVHQGTARRLKGSELNRTFSAVSIPGESLQLFYLRPVPSQGAYHLWGGKRLAEAWDDGTRRLTATLEGPAGLQDTIYFGSANQSIAEVKVGGIGQPFLFDPAQGLVHGKVTFGSQPLQVEVLCAPSGDQRLPEGPAPGDSLRSLFQPGK